MKPFVFPSYFFIAVAFLQFSALTGEDSLSGYESTESDLVKAFSKLNYILSGRCYLPTEQDEKIAAIVKKIQPEIPILVAQMKKSNIKRLSARALSTLPSFPFATVKRGGEGRFPGSGLDSPFPPPLRRPRRRQRGRGNRIDRVPV